MNQGSPNMSNPSSFAEVLDAIDQLPIEDQETLIDIVRHRLADQGRKRVVADVAEARLMKRRSNRYSNRRA